MATIRKRGPYQFQALVRRKGHPQQTKTFESSQEAQAWARQIEAQMDAGSFKNLRPMAKITLHQALQRYAQEVTALKKAPQSEFNRIAALQRHPLALKTMEELQAADFSAYNLERLKKVSNTTIRLELALLSNLYSTATTEWSWPLMHVLKDVKKPRANRGRNRRLTTDEFQRLIEGVHRPEARSTRVWLHAAIVLAIDTGMRAGEILQVKWSDVDIENRVITLHDTKNNEPREVPLSLEGLALLLALPRISQKVIGGFHDVNGMGDALRKACRHANIKDFRFHDFRHEAASQFAPHMSAPSLAKLMGWKTIQMAMRYYNPSKAELKALRDSVKSNGLNTQMARLTEARLEDHRYHEIAEQMG